MPDDKAARIAALRAQRDAIDAEILQLSREAIGDVVKAAGMTDKMREFFMPLPSTSRDGTNEPTPMEAQTVIPSRASKISGTKAERSKAALPWQKALQVAGITAQEWAARQKSPAVGAEKARSWMKKRGRGGRPIPRFWAERIAKEFPGVPAVDASWPSGIRD